MIPLTEQTIVYPFFGLLATFVAIQTMYWLFVFSRLAWAKKTPPDKPQEVERPVSIVVDGRNAQVAFDRIIPALYSQEYSGRFEVVAVNDQSADESELTLEVLRRKYPSLHVVAVPNSERFYNSKKFPLTLGIKAAKTETILLTHADHLPASAHWMRSMMTGYREGVRTVLGVVRLAKAPGYINKLARYRHNMRQLHLLGWAQWGLPMAGDGGNLTYDRPLFFEHKGFLSHMHIGPGEDDLFINEVSSVTQAKVIFQPQAQMEAPAPTTKAEWLRIGRRYAETQAHYRSSHRTLLGIFTFSQRGFWWSALFSAAVCVLFPSYFPLWGLLFAFRMAVAMMQWGLASRFLSHADTFVWFPLLEIHTMWLESRLALERLFTPTNKRW